MAKEAILYLLESVLLMGGLTGTAQSCVGFGGRISTWSLSYCFLLCAISEFPSLPLKELYICLLSVLPMRIQVHDYHRYAHTLWNRACISRYSVNICRVKHSLIVDIDIFPSTHCPLVSTTHWVGSQDASHWWGKG